MNSSLLPWGNSPWNNSLLTGCVAEQHTGNPIFLSFPNMIYAPTQVPTLLQHILVTKRKLFCPHAWEHCLLSALHPFCSVPKIYLPTELAYPALYFWLATARLLLSMLLPSLAFCLASRRPRSTFSLQKMPHWSPGIQEALLELTCWKAIPHLTFLAVLKRATIPCLFPTYFSGTSPIKWVAPLHHSPAILPSPPHSYECLHRMYKLPQLWHL